VGLQKSVSVCHVWHSLARIRVGSVEMQNSECVRPVEVQSILCVLQLSQDVLEMQAYCVINLLCRGVLKRTRNISELVSVDVCICIDTDFFGLTE